MCSLPLHLFQDTLLELPLHLLTLLIRARLAVKGKQSAEVELGLLQQLNLADVNLYIQSASLCSVTGEKKILLCQDLGFIMCPRTFCRG